MGNEKKLLYICSRVFWPPMGGHEVEMYHYCRGLHDLYGYSIDVYAFDSEDKLVGVEKPVFLSNVYISRPINTATKISNLFFKSLFQSWPLQNSLYYSEKNANRIEELVKSKDYDVVMVDMIRLAPYYKAFKVDSCKKILDIDDTLSKRYKRQLNAISDKTNIAGQYHNRLPSVIKKIISSTFIKRCVLKFEIPRMEKAERYYAELYDKAIFVSQLETEEFNRKYNTDKAVTVSLGVDFQYFSEELNVKKIPGYATFVGNMATPANADSVRYIVNEVLPKCKILTKFVCVGNCPKELEMEFSGNEKLEFTGKVDDLRTYVESGMVFLAPIAYGTGIKTKILEAMAMGMPVITNLIGAEGIHAVHEEHWYVSDNATKIAEYVDDLLESQQKCATMGRAAQGFVKDYFQWDIIFKQFDKLGM